MNNRQGPQEVIPCPGCNGTKLKEMALCRSCKKDFTTEAADIVLAGKIAPSYEEWLEKRLQTRIPVLRAELKSAQQKLGAVQRKADERLRQLLIERTDGQELSSDVLEEIKLKLKEREGNNVWRAIGGAAIYRDCKIASSRLQEACRLLKDLEAKKAPSPLLEYGEKILKQK
jgi:hypothetical protein